MCPVSVDGWCGREKKTEKNKFPMLWMRVCRGVGQRCRGMSGSSSSNTRRLKAETGSKEERKARKARHDDILCTTRDVVEGRQIVQELGVVVGTSVKSRHMGSDLLARLKSFFMGGELRGYTALINAATLEATRVALDTAHELGATSLVRVRYQANTTMDSMSGAFTQVLCYGTAVKCTPRVDAKTPSTLVEMPPVDAKMIHCSSSMSNLNNQSEDDRVDSDPAMETDVVPHVQVELVKVLPGRETHLRKSLMTVFPDMTGPEVAATLSQLPAMLTYCPEDEAQEIARALSQAGGEVALHTEEAMREQQQKEQEQSPK